MLARLSGIMIFLLIRRSLYDHLDVYAVTFWYYYTFFLLADVD